MPGSAPMWAKELRMSLRAEIAAIDKGERSYEHAGKDKTEVTAAGLKKATPSLGAGRGPDLVV